MSIYSMKRNFRKRWKILSELWLPFSKTHISLHVSAASFYILLSLLPAFALSLTILSLLPVTSKQWTQLLEDFVPVLFHPVIAYFSAEIEPKHPSSLASAWAVLTLWSASKGVMSMTDGLTSILETQNQRGFIRRRLDAMAVFLLLAITVSTTLILHVFGKRFLLQSTSLHPLFVNLFIILYRLRYLYSLLILSVLFAVLYWLLPGRPFRFRTSLAAGVLSAISVMLLSTAFTIYVNYMQSYHKLYGWLGLFLLGCIWLQLCMRLLLNSVLFIKLLRDDQYHPLTILKRSIS